MKRLRPFLLRLGLLLSLALQPAVAAFPGTPLAALTLADGQILPPSTVVSLSPAGLVLQIDRSLRQVPLHLLPSDLRAQVQAGLDLQTVSSPPTARSTLSTPAPAGPGSSSPASSYLDQRRAEIAANREAERQAMIAAAARPEPASGTAAPLTTGPSPIWRGLEITRAEFDCRSGFAILYNHETTSVSLESWDLQVVFSDGHTRSVQILRPFRAAGQSSTWVSFRLPDYHFATPRFLQFREVPGLLVSPQRNCTYFHDDSFSRSRRRVSRPHS